MESAQTDGQKRAQIQYQIKDFGAKARKSLTLTIVGSVAAVLVVIGTFAAVIALNNNIGFAVGLLLVPVMTFTRKAWDRHCTFKLERKMLKDDLLELGTGE